MYFKFIAYIKKIKMNNLNINYKQFICFMDIKILKNAFVL